MTPEHGQDLPPFRLLNEGAAGLPVVLAVPHAGRRYHPDLLARMRHPLTLPLRLEDRHADTLAQAVARLVAVPVIMAETPRAAIDLNRAEDDVDWSMIAGAPGRRLRHSAANHRARSGLGLVPRRVPGEGEIWRAPLAHAELARRIERVHRPYHRRLGLLLESQRDRWGAALLVDLHSMPPLPARGADEGGGTARVVVGDRFGASCHGALSAEALRAFAESSVPVAHNRPYAGGYVLDRHGQPRRGIHALQLEICRTVYLDGALAEPGERLPETAALLARVIRRLAAVTAMLGRGHGQVLAAE